MQPARYSTPVSKVMKIVKSSFPVRRMNFEFDQVNRYWFDDDAGLTHFMNALSCLFPPGERFFVDTLQHLRGELALKSDAVLQAEVKAFMGQESMHFREHEAFNRSAREQGLAIEHMQNIAARLIGWRRFYLLGRNHSKLDLAATAALEHYTATIAAKLLSREDMHEWFQDPAMAQLWLWHALEEMEHKSVAFDAFEALYGKDRATYIVRCYAMIISTFMLFSTHTVFTLFLMYQDKKLSPKHLKRVLNVMYGPKGGFFTDIIPELLDYFREDFHPNDHDTQQLLEKWRAELGFEEILKAAPSAETTTATKAATA